MQQTQDETAAGEGLNQRERTWTLIAKRASLLRSGKIRQDTAQCMKREVKAALKADKTRLTAEVGENIVS